MKKNLQDQFDNIKKLIRLNIESINSLIEQSDCLKKMIENTPLEESVKNKLRDIRENMVDSINSLMEHTDSLFNSYDNIIDKISSK